jgi:hypothetical protein
MKLDIDDLRTACHEVARATMWEQRPIDESIIDAHSERLFRIAREHEEFITGQGRDPNLIIRAVRYLAHAHAIPPMRDDVHWFSTMLWTLIELACPNTGTTQDLETFFRDIEEGIAVARADYRDSPKLQDS